MLNNVMDAHGASLCCAVSGGGGAGVLRHAGRWMIEGEKGCAFAGLDGTLDISKWGRRRQSTAVPTRLPAEHQGPGRETSVSPLVPFRTCSRR